MKFPLFTEINSNCSWKKNDGHIYLRDSWERTGDSNRGYCECTRTRADQDIRIYRWTRTKRAEDNRRSDAGRGLIPWHYIYLLVGRTRLHFQHLRLFWPLSSSGPSDKPASSLTVPAWLVFPTISMICTYVIQRTVYESSYSKTLSTFSAYCSIYYFEHLV